METPKPVHPSLRDGQVFGFRSHGLKPMATLHSTADAVHGALARVSNDSSELWTEFGFRSRCYFLSIADAMQSTVPG